MQRLKRRARAHSRSLARTAERYAREFPASPRNVGQEKSIRRRLGLLGDAAGFADPVTGEGIYYASTIGGVICRSLSERTPESYEKRWREDFGAELTARSPDATALLWQLLGRTLH
jgi:flavin-dependent dehydrogenase